MRRLRAMLLAGIGAVVCAAPAPAHGQQPAPSTVRDLAWGEVLFEHYQQHRMQALVRLAMAETRGELEHHRADARLLEGGLYLAWGLRDEAAAIFEQLLASSAPPAQRDQAWYWLARIYYERNEPAPALAALRRIGGALPAQMVADRADLEARVLLALGEYEQAAGFLAAHRQPGAWQRFADFNRAVALNRAGRHGEAEALLDRLGRARADDGELALLRDRANLALGLARLDAGDPRGARAALDRVRLESPLAPRALLAAGWAEAGQERYRQALGPWQRLASRPDLDGASLEALLALPWAWYQLDEPGESVRGYRHAAAACEAELARLAAARQLVASEALLRFALADDSVAADARLGSFLHTLSADHPFRAVASDLRDLEALRENLLDWQQSLGALRDMVEVRRARFAGIVPRVEEQLEANDLDRLELRVTALSRRVSALRDDGVAEDLANAAERRTLERLHAIGERVEALPAGPERDELDKRRSRLAGALHWQLNHAWPERIHATARELRAVESELARAHENRGRIAARLAEGPAGFEGYDAQIDLAAARVAGLLERVERDRERRLGALRALALAELEARELRVATYLGEARFALAAAYDQAAQPRAALPAGAEAVLEDGR